MPNDLTAKRNLFDARADAPTSQRQKLTSSGFTATIWTLSGVVLVACGNLEEFLGLDDDGGGGNTLHVRSSAVQGARLYFDTDGVGGVTQIEKDAQDALYPEGFITDAAGQAHGIPAEFYGKPFIADLSGAINTETGESLSGQYASIANARGLHLLASPITEYIDNAGGDPKDVVADLINEQDAESEAVQAQLQAILNPANYLGGDEGVEALSYHITTLTNPTPSTVESQAVQLLTTDPTDPNRDTLIIVDARDMTKTIGTDSTYIATIHAVSHGDSPVRYSIVESDGTPIIGGDFNVDSHTGVVSVADGATLTASNTAISVYVRVSNDDSEQTVKIDITVEPVVTLSHATSAGSVAENEAGAIAVEGIETSDNVIATDFTISDGLGVVAGAGYAGMFEMEAATGATNTWNLKLKSDAMLDFETIPGGVINLRVHVEPSDHAPSNILEIAVTVTDDPSDIAFSGVVRGEVTKDSDDYEVSGTITIANQPQNEAVSVSSQGTYGTLTFDSDSGTWTYTLDNTESDVQNLLEGQLLIDTAELTVGSVTQNISIIVMGANEDVHFVETATPTNRVSAVDVPTDIEIGDTAIDGNFALGNIFMDLGITLMGRLDDAETTTVEFADSVSADLRALFSLSPSGDLEFIGTNAQAIGLGTRPINLNLLVSAPLSTTEQIPLNLQVNIINAVDDGMADYVVTENRDTMELTVALVDADPASATYSGDPDGVVGGVRFQWFTTTDGGLTKTAIANANAATLDISASAPLPAGTTYGVTITYTDNHDIANGETTEFDVLATTVQFTATPNAPIEIAEADSIDPATLGTAGVLATVEAESSAEPPQTVTYALDSVVDDAGNAVTGLFSVDSDDGEIKFTGSSLDYETAARYTLTITASARQEAGSTEMDMDTATVIIVVTNAQEGPAEYEISRAEADNGGVITTTLTVALIDADPNSATYSGDPDGVVGAVMFRWFTTDGTNKTYLGEASTSNTRDISANPNLSYGVEVSYTDGQGMDEEFDVFASSVRFTTPPPASIDVSEAASADYATLGVNGDGILGRFAATSSAEPPQTVTYTFEALDDSGMPVANATGLFSISNGEISLLSNVDFETTPQYTLIITASARKEANSMEMDTAVARVTINVLNDQDGDAEYEVTENDAGTILTVELVAGDFDINTPDGAPTNPQYRWFTTANGGMTKDYITDADSASFTIADHPLEAGEIYGVTVSYQDPLYDASDPSTLTEIDVLASPIDFTDGTDSVPSYAGTINEDGTLLADNAGDDIPLPQVMAVVDDAPPASEIKYGFLVDAGTGMTITSRLGFKIDEDDGTITVSSTIPGTDFNYDLDPPRESITLTVRATYDSNGATTGGEVHTRDVDVVITVNDLNDETPEFAPLQIVENSGAVAGIPTLAGITGTTGADHIAGGDGNDEIASGGGNDHIFGDAGNDEITLSTDADNVETIYYRFASSDSGDFAATDGTDTIKGFRRGEDKLVLIDTDGTLITLNDFLSDTHREQGGNLFVVPLLDSATGTILIGVQIDFGNTNALRIEYATDSQVADVRNTGGGVWQTAGDPYVGTNGANIVSGGVLNDNTLLRNYFNVNSDDDNLQVIGTADIPTIFGADVFISESRTSADGAFATISATDADVAVIDLSYRIAGGSGMGIFELHPTDNTLSVASTATLNYETATEYTLDLEVTDGTNPATQTITIGLIDINDSDPTATTGGIDTFAERAAVASDTETDFFITISDDDTDAVNEHNVMVVGAHASRFKFVEDGTTANQWNLVLIEGQEVDREDSSYVLSGVLTVEYEITDGTRFTSQTNSVGLRIDDINDNGPTVTASQTDAGTPITINERIDGSKTPLDVMGLTIEIADADVTAGHKSGVLGIEPDFVVRNADDLSPNSLFQVENVNGKWVLQFTDPILEGESDPSIALVIEVSDGTNLFDRTDTFTVNVINLDEGPGVYRVDGDVTMGAGQALTVVQVTPDPDGINGDVTYQWYKEVNGTRTMLTADSGNPNQYTLQTGDDPTTELFGAIVLYTDDAGVVYDNTNDNPTIDVQANYAPEITGFTDADGMTHTTAPTINISTNMNRVQEVLASITATDRNTVDTLTYAFVVNGKPTLYTSGGLETFEVTINNEVVEAIDEGGFNIDPTTGRITFSGTLHQDAHDDDKLPLTLKVQVSDGTATTTATATAQIKVDFLENTGTTTFATTYSRGEADNFYVGTQLGVGSEALDPDTVATQIKYDYFRLVESTDPISGETIITEEDALIQTPGQAQAYVFTAEDVGHKILVRATYKDLIGNKEVFEHTTAIVVPAPAEASSARLIITEGIADDSVITYATTDGTINTDTDLSYAITGIKDASDTAMDISMGGAFEIRSADRTAGTIYRKQGDANRLDHETNDSYTLTITVTDNSDNTTSMHDIVIEVGDINESPTETTSFAPGTSKVSVHRATTTSNTEDVSTGYRVTIADEDGAHFNTMLTLMSTTTGFVFKEVMGQANTYELFLEKGVAIDRNKIVEYQFSDGVNTVTENVTVQIEADGEAKIPDRQAETHEPINPDYNPDDDPIAGLTPIPDTDPYA